METKERKVGKEGWSVRAPKKPVQASRFFGIKKWTTEGGTFGRSEEEVAIPERREMSGASKDSKDPSMGEIGGGEKSEKVWTKKQKKKDGGRVLTALGWHHLKTSGEKNDWRAKLSTSRCSPEHSASPPNRVKSYKSAKKSV